MPFLEEATCHFHLNTSRENRIARLRCRIVTTTEVPTKSTPPEFEGKHLNLLTEIKDWQDVLICAGCYRKLSEGDAAHQVLKHETAFKYVRSGNAEGHICTLALRDKERTYYGVLGDYRAHGDDRSVGLMCHDGSYTQDIRFVIPSEKNLPLLYPFRKSVEFARMEPRDNRSGRTPNSEPSINTDALPAPAPNSPSLFASNTASTAANHTSDTTADSQVTDPTPSTTLCEVDSRHEEHRHRLQADRSPLQRYKARKRANAEADARLVEKRRRYEQQMNALEEAFRREQNLAREMAAEERRLDEGIAEIDEELNAIEES